MAKGESHNYLVEEHVEKITGKIRTLTGANDYLTVADAGKQLIFNKVTGCIAHLPAAIGSGDRYRFFVATTVTSNNYVVRVNASPGTDTMAGAIIIATDAGGITDVAGGTDDTLTMNGSTTGGVAGTWLEFTDVKPGLWQVAGQIVCTGNEASGFSAAVP